MAKNSHICRMTTTLVFSVFFCIAAMCYDCKGREDGWIQEIGCWGYTDCLDGKSVKHECPANTVYDRETRKCVQLGTNSIGCGQAANCTGRIDGFYTEPPCTTFYRCMGESNVGRYYCPANLVFNTEKQICDWMNNVRPPCGKSLRH